MSFLFNLIYLFLKLIYLNIFYRIGSLLLCAGFL